MAWARRGERQGTGLAAQLRTPARTATARFGRRGARRESNSILRDLAPRHALVIADRETGVRAAVRHGLEAAPSVPRLTIVVLVPPLGLSLWFPTVDPTKLRKGLEREAVEIGRTLTAECPTTVNVEYLALAGTADPCEFIRRTGADAVFVSIASWRLRTRWTRGCRALMERPEISAWIEEL